jgi:hypothetical protein
MVTCADTSFLFSLYGNDAHTPRVLAWMKSQRGALTLTTLSEYELGNALRFSEFRKGLAPGGAALFWAQFEADRASGRLQIQVCNLADVVDEAKRLSATHTLTGGVWGKIWGPNSIWGPKLGITEMPTATNISRLKP